MSNNREVLIKFIKDNPEKFSDDQAKNALTYLEEEEEEQVEKAIETILTKGVVVGNVESNLYSAMRKTCSNCDGNCLCKASKGIDNNHDIEETGYKEINHDIEETGYKEANQE